MSADLPVFIFDSFAVLASVGGEPGMVRIQDILDKASNQRCQVFLSVINLGEVIYITEREAGLAKAQTVLSAVEQLPIEILPASKESVLAAAHIKAQFPVAYADAFAIAAAQEHKGVVLTGDPEFHSVEKQVKVEWLAV